MKVILPVFKTLLSSLVGFISLTSLKVQMEIDWSLSLNESDFFDNTFPVFVLQEGVGNLAPSILLKITTNKNIKNTLQNLKKKLFILSHTKNIIKIYAFF